jgi:hypothetical protein
MAQYPVDSEDGLYEAVNYLASGPAGLGQNFQGFSAYVDPQNTNADGDSVPVPEGYLTGNFRRPYVYNVPTELYVDDIALSNAEALSPKTVKFTFASTQATVPFLTGQIIESYDITESGTGESFNSSWGPVGVVSCTTDYVIVQTPDDYTYQTYVSGGFVYLTTTGNFYNSTDCNARVNVTGAQDRVFISAQINNIINVNNLDSSNGPFQYTVAINRYVGFLNNDPVNPDFLFIPDTSTGSEDGTIALKRYQFDPVPGATILPNIETIFSTIVDEPDPGYYWYILEVGFRSYDYTTDTFGDVEVTSSELGLRSISVQVIKE